VRKAIDTDFLPRFGKRIRELRTAKKYSQEELADKAELHWTYIGQIERGERNPTLKNIVKLARALDISMGELFSFDN
jgi:transcriptional regulator with XRE-family HTH domain